MAKVALSALLVGAAMGAFARGSNDPAHVSVSGNVSGKFDVIGWGADTATATQVLQVSHNHVVDFMFSGFNDLTSVNTPSTSANTLPFFLTLAIDGSVVFDGRAMELNGRVIRVSPAMSTGSFNFAMTRRVALGSEAGPGSYQNVGTIRISSY